MAAEMNAPKILVDFGSMEVPVLDDYRMQGVLTAKFLVSVGDSRDKDKLEIERPKAVDAYVRYLTNFARLWVDPTRPVDVPRLSNTLKDATSEILGSTDSKIYVLEATVRRR